MQRALVRVLGFEHVEAEVAFRRFVMTAGEVNPVIRALREHGIQVTALHSHMLTETPRLFFMHFWANDDATKLARGLRAALDQTASKPAAKSASR